MGELNIIENVTILASVIEMIHFNESLERVTIIEIMRNYFPYFSLSHFQRYD